MDNPGFKKEFGVAVKTQRNRLGLSQETLAERANLHRTYITDIERGARNLSLESIWKLAGALGMPIQALFSSAGAGEHREKPPAVPRQIVNMLLVEDDARDAELALETFTHYGLANHITVVRDGESALDFLFCRRQHLHRDAETDPQLVLLDLGLPKVHGLDVLRQLRGDERTRALPVVVLTGSHKDDHIQTALGLGAQAYIVKPLNFQSLSAITPKLSFHWALLGSDVRPRA